MSRRPLLPAEVSMDLLLSKMQLLDYEREFCRRKKPRRKPLTPNYFSEPPTAGGGGANEQFFTFASLAAWLLQACGAQAGNPKEFDDPNATLSGLLSAARGLGGPPAAAAAGAPAPRLAAGWGAEVCGLLDALAGAALERRGFRFAPPVYAGESGAPEAEEEDGGDDLGAVDLTEEAASGGAGEGEDDEDGDDYARLAFGGGAAALAAEGSSGDGAAGGGGGGAGGGAGGGPPERAPLCGGGVDATAWKLEAERVAPRLRLAAAADAGARDWRQHLDAAHAAAAALSGGWPAARAALARLGADAGGALERLEAREGSLNAALSGPLAEYAAARRALAEAQDEAAARADAVGAADGELHRLGAALEEAKGALDARGSSLSDASPLVRIKAAIEALRGELGGMEVRIGVVGHTLAQLSLSDKQAAARDAAARGGEGARAAGGGGARAAAGVWGP
ncbi:MAG: intra-flagellar transport protein 57-domain-containing protein [Monoraphidium minutum]|nr:MAG: intra-flagellar transport protein 57-domain-containing protein [Monoraphidium minutum]